MNHINKTLLAAALGSSLMALEACRKWDTNRLAGRWRLVRSDNFVDNNTKIIFDFAKDGDFTKEVTITYANPGPFYTLTNNIEGKWKWASRQRLKIDFDLGVPYSNLEFEEVLIQGNDMELTDDDNYDWIFQKE